jgi:exopolysaccharide biosynthesis protein
VDGRQQTSVGATLAQLGRLVVDLGYPQAVALDGGGSTQMVRRPAGGALAVVNSPSDTPLRRVRDGLAVVPAGR